MDLVEHTEKVVLACVIIILIRSTPLQTHNDYESLTKAAGMIGEVASYLEERSREAERTAKVLDIQSHFYGDFEVQPKSYVEVSNAKTQNLATPTRKFVKQGEAVVCAQGDRSKRARILFLFNDLLVETVPIKRGVPGALKFKRSFGLNNIIPYPMEGKYPHL